MISELGAIDCRRLRSKEWTARRVWTVEYETKKVTPEPQPPVPDTRLGRAVQPNAWARMTKPRLPQFVLRTTPKHAPMSMVAIKQVLIFVSSCSRSMLLLLLPLLLLLLEYNS